MPPQYAGLAAWLPAHHLTDGLSGYHQANIVTLESGGAVTVRAVHPAAGGQIRAYAWNASRRWFDPAGHAANFLVITAAGAPADGGRLGADPRPGDGDVRPPRQDLPVRRVS